MTCSFCLGGLATPYVLQNSSFGFKRALTRPRKTLRLATIRQTFVAFCPSVARDQRAPVPRHGRRHSRKFIHFRLPDPPPPPHLPKAAASRLIEGGAGESEALPGTALLRPFYRLGAGVAGRASPGRVGGGGGVSAGKRWWGGPAAPFMEERGGSAARTASSSSPYARRRHRRSPGRARLPRRAPSAAAGPGPAGGRSGGCWWRTRWGRSGRAAAASSCTGAGRQRGPGSGRGPGLGGAAAAAGHPAFRSGGGRRSAQAGGRARPRRLSGRWSEGARLGSGKMAGGGGGGCRDSLFLDGACMAERGGTRPVGCVSLLATSKGHGADRGMGEAGVCVCVHLGGGGGRNGSPLGDGDNERWLRGGGRVGAVRGGLVWWKESCFWGRG